MKKILVLLLAVALMVQAPAIALASEPAEQAPKAVTTAEVSGNVVRSGECGTGGYQIVWELYDNGTLLFKGAGNMMDFDSDGGIWCMYQDTIKNVVIRPGISSIGEYAFFRCQMIESVSLPDTLTKIGNSSFYGTWSLLNLYIPDSVTTIYKPQFNTSCKIWCGAKSKPSDWNFQANSIMYGVSKSEYDFWTGLTGEETSVTIPDECTLIPESAFSNNKNLKEVTIPDTIKSIGNNAFYYCTGLTKITIPDSVTSIGSSAFEGCKGLTDITIPGSVTKIGFKAFYDCSLNSVYIPDSVERISEEAFAQNTGCSIYCRQASQPEGWHEKWCGDANVIFAYDEATHHKMSVSLGYTTAVYSGYAKKPSVQVADGYGSKLIEGIDYTVTYKDNVNAGTAKVIVEGKGDFAGTVTKTFTIKPISYSSSKFSAKLSPTSYVYNGSVKSPGLTVKYGSKTLKSGTDYKVTKSSGRKYVGTYRYTIKFTGNYSGSTYRTFEINPKGTSIRKLTKARKAFTVQWNKQAIQTTGYQIRYSLKSSMASAKTVTVTKNNVTSKKISKLKAKKKYYVQVRTYKTVKGKKYYSSWPKMKYVTTK